MMPKALTRFMLAVLLVLPLARAGTVFPGAAWETRTPVQAGLDAAKLDQFRALAGGGPGCVIKDGYLVYSWGTQTLHGEWASASKPVYATLMFMAIEEGRAGGVGDLVKDYNWNLSAKDQTMTLEHLANMISGYALPENPGAAWGYNDYGIKLWALTLLNRMYGADAASDAETEAVFLAANRFGPLQFQDGDVLTIKNGAPRINMTPRDFCRVGWFWLNRGRWNGAQLVPQSYFDNYMKPIVPAGLPRTAGGTNDYLGIGSHGGGSNQTALGPGIYGYAWWHNPNRQTWPDAPADTFQANGHWNKEVLTVIPSLGIVAAWRGGTGAPTDSFAGPMNLVLKPLVESVQAAPANQAPSVDAGPDRTVTLPVSASLDGAVSDDGLPNPPGTATVMWFKQSGPGTVTFGNANAVDTTASFSAAGTYVLKLEAGDGELSASDTVTVTVNPAPPSGPLPGQIIVHPDTPRWLAYNRDNDGDGKPDPFFMCGPGDPEDFLYRGARNADGTRSGDQLTLIDKIIGTGANCIYFQAVRSHGGDGAADHNPFEGSDPNNALDPDILNQWELWFDAMDDNGIVIYFFFFDDSAGFAAAREDYMLCELVNRFEHHKHLVWCIAEEYQEQFTAARVSELAAIVRAEDDHDHPIAVHKLSGLSFSEFADDPNIDQFAIQYNQGAADSLHAGMVTAWDNAAGKYNLNMSEAASYGTGATARLKDWACAMGGAYVMRLGMDIASTSVSDLQDCGRLRAFFESFDVSALAPHDELKHGGTQYVLANPGAAYAAYASNLSGSLGLKSLTSGTYTLKWLDCVTGASVTQNGVGVAAGDQTFAKPGGIGNELALYLKRTGGGANAAPTALPQNVSVAYQTAQAIALTYTDPDGPGPYTFAIASGPAHGALSGNGANRTYAPAAGYSGPDSFAFTVHDGLATSAAATVSITVQAPGNAAPVANNQSLSTPQGTPVTMSLSYSDPDGPGPYTVTILSQPTHGSLGGAGNDRTYTPAAGYTGADNFTWRVNDGLANSNTATVSLAVTAPPAAGLLAHWKFDETSGTVAADATGNGWTGTLVNGPTWTAGQVSGGLQFDGSNDRVSVAGTFAPPAKGTVAFWAMVTIDGARQRILGGHDAWEITIESNGKLANQLNSAGSNTLQSAASVPNGQWLHVACTYDSASNARQTYFNGSLDASSTNHDNTGPGSFALTLGTRTGASDYFSGVLDDVRIYDRVLSAAEIAALANTPPPNQPPAIESGAWANPNPVTLPATTAVNVVASDPDGGPQPLAYTWSKVSGPGSVGFTPNGSVSASQSTASFSAAGEYTLRVSVSDGEATVTDDVVVAVNPAPPSNTAPDVGAGPDLVLTLPASASLGGSVGDDGLPNPPGAVTVTWSKLSGPGAVTFGNANAIATSASFSVAGTYTLRLTASDSQLSASDDVTVIVNPAPPVNAAPAVSAGPDLAVTLPASATLDGAVSDDGLPNPPSAVSVAWAKVSGPGTVSFGNSNAVDTTATFSAPGGYILRLTASDSQLSASDEVFVAVDAMPVSSLIANVVASTGTAYEVDTLAAGKLVYVDRAFTFTNVPAAYAGQEFIRTANNDKTVNAANYLTFTLTAAASVYVAYDVRASSAPSFIDGSWTTVADTLGTSDVSRVLYRKDFAAGTVVLGGNQQGGPTGAGSNYNVLAIAGGSPPPPPNQPPQITSVAASPNPVTLPAGVMLGASAVDPDGGPAPLSYVWSQLSGPGTVSFVGANAASASASFFAAGTYVLRVTVSDGMASAYADVSVDANPEPPPPPPAGFELAVAFVSTGKAYDLSVAEAGGLIYIDRSYTIASLSAALGGAALIRTANNDKNVAVNPHLTFTISQAATVYVGYDKRATALPAWLDGSWTLTGESLASTDGAAGPMRVYAKSFPAGSVTLGGNKHGGNTGAGSHYVVIVAPSASGAGDGVGSRAAAGARGFEPARLWWHDGDRDGDGLLDVFELARGLNPDAIDSDGDGNSDEHESLAGRPLFEVQDLDAEDGVVDLGSFPIRTRIVLNVARPAAFAELRAVVWRPLDKRVMPRALRIARDRLVANVRLPGEYVFSMLARARVVVTDPVTHKRRAQWLEVRRTFRLTIVE
ncbi:MAG: Ig-like domain-containing protein [Planctomycetota bacterium]|nr:Ig-like domain-containing protein [Planctomycetota bacterium]